MDKRTLTLLPPKESRGPNSQVVAILKALLEKAEAGTLDGIAAIVTYPPTQGEPAVCFGSVFAINPDNDLLGFLGMAEVLKTRIVSQIEIPERDG